MAKTTKNASDITVLGTDAEAFRKAFTDHIHHTLARSKYTVTDHEKFLAVAYAVRDRLTLTTKRTSSASITCPWNS